MHRAARRAATQSLSFDARFRALDRAEAPFGLTLNVAPHWGFVDEASGVRTDHSGAEVQLLADCEFKPARLIGADRGRRYRRTAPRPRSGGAGFDLLRRGDPKRRWRMSGGMTNVAGIEIPSTDPAFLAVTGIHILLGLACTVTGVVAMLSKKREGRHPRYGTIYYWCLTGVFVTATGLAAVRWAEDYHLFILGALSFAAAYFGRQARRQRWRNWARLHISGMAASYILLLTAFYVDNGKSLPLWKALPSIAYWLLPAAVGVPLIIRALLWHPLARRPSPP